MLDHLNRVKVVGAEDLLLVVSLLEVDAVIGQVSEGEARAADPDWVDRVVDELVLLGFTQKINPVVLRLGSIEPEEIVIVTVLIEHQLELAVEVVLDLHWVAIRILPIEQLHLLIDVIHCEVDLLQHVADLGVVLAVGAVAYASVAPVDFKGERYAVAHRVATFDFGMLLELLNIRAQPILKLLEYFLVLKQACQLGRVAVLEFDVVVVALSIVSVADHDGHFDIVLQLVRVDHEADALDFS